MSALFLKTIKAKRILPEELEYLDKSFQVLKQALLSGSLPDISSIPSSAAALYVFALHSEKNKEEVLRFVDWFNNHDLEDSWSEGFLNLISRFFGELQLNRIGVLLEKISLQKSLTHVSDAAELVSSLHDKKLKGLYNNKVDELNIDFSVSLLPFEMEVLDPRIVTVQPGKANEMHRHAHETVFIFLKGQGKVVVDQFENPVGPGDFAFIPRWCNHQSVNTGSEELVFLAVADFGLTGKSFIGNYLKTARMKTL